MNGESIFCSTSTINRAELYRMPTDTVEVLTGHRPRTIHEYIARHRKAFAQ
jgi:hypothetical protein